MRHGHRGSLVKLWRFLTNLIERKVSFNGIEFTEVKVGQLNIDGFPDLVVYASEKGKQSIPIPVIETKVSKLSKMRFEMLKQTGLML